MKRGERALFLRKGEVKKKTETSKSKLEEYQNVCARTQNVCKTPVQEHRETSLKDKKTQGKWLRVFENQDFALEIKESGLKQEAVSRETSLQGKWFGARSC